MTLKFPTLLLVLLFSLAAIPSFAQPQFFKVWDNGYGTSANEYLISAIQLQNSNFLLSGYSLGNVEGDKSQPSRGGEDYWVVCVDAAGNKLWDKCFGGNGTDVCQAAMETNTGILLAGYSFSGLSGDKTEASRGAEDYWVVFIDKAGNKLWDHRYGGSSEDLLYSAALAGDGGFVLVGSSSSPIGGDKSEAPWYNGAYPDDCWVVKIDSLGNKQWDKRIGSLGIETGTTITATADHGYLIGGWSDGDSSGNKNSHLLGFRDFWLIKLDANGNKLWDRSYGGIYSDECYKVLSLPNGDILTGGMSYSPPSVTRTAVRYGYWLLRIDSDGNNVWDKGYGGDIYEELDDIALTKDGGFLLTGESRSDAVNDKSEDNLGDDQTWVVRTDSAGNKIWDKTILTTKTNAPCTSIELADDCILTTTFCSGGIGGYKKKLNHDATNVTFDYWILKYCMQPVGITETTGDLQWQIGPNPATNELSIFLSKPGLNNATFTITNSLGQTVYQKQENNLSDSYTKMLDITYLPAGTYFVTVTVGNQKAVKQIVKQ